MYNVRLVPMTDYKPQQLDKKWQAHWTSTRAFEVTEDPARPKFYCLEMFAYPSGHAHVGHVRNNVFWLRANDRGTLRIAGPGLPTRHVRLG